MITEDCVSFEVAKLLKEKGFDGKCSCIWVKENELPLRIVMSSFVEGEEVADRKTVEQATNYNNKYKFKSPVTAYLCPTFQMVMKWLRENYRLYIDIELLSGPCFSWYIWFMNDPQHMMGCSEDINIYYYDSYEQTCGAAIKYCLENLI